MLSIAHRATLRLETIRAIDRSALRGLEWNRGLAATIRAGNLKALTLAVPPLAIPVGAATGATTRSLADLAAGWAACGLVGEPLLRVELLLSDSEDELVATIATGERLVSETHYESTPHGQNKDRMLDGTKGLGPCTGEICP